LLELIRLRIQHDTCDACTLAYMRDTGGLAWEWKQFREQSSNKRVSNGTCCRRFGARIDYGLVGARSLGLTGRRCPHGRITPDLFHSGTSRRPFLRTLEFQKCFVQLSAPPGRQLLTALIRQRSSERHATVRPPDLLRESFRCSAPPAVTLSPIKVDGKTTPGSRPALRDRALWGEARRRGQET
jgi:hypothetical protein